MRSRLDANVKRFMELVKEFSKTYPFVFIVYNKNGDGDGEQPLRHHP